MKWFPILLAVLIGGCQATAVVMEPEFVPAEDPTKEAAQEFLDALKDFKEQAAVESFKRSPSCADGSCQLKGAAYLPQGLRIANYNGSCYHASLAMAFNNSNMPDWAEDWTNRYRGGESASGLHWKLDRAGIDYIATTDGNVAVLDYAHRTSRIAPITFKDDHVCVFIRWEEDDFGRRWAILVDPNKRKEEEVWTEQAFINKWRSHGGAATVVLAPVNPPSLSP